MDDMPEPVQTLAELKQDLCSTLITAKECGYKGISVDISLELAVQLCRLISEEQQWLNDNAQDVELSEGQ